MFDYDELMNLIDGEDFDERPVELEEFVYGYEYLDITSQGRAPIHLSEEQMNLIHASTQIYKESTLINLYGEEEGKKRHKQTYNEIIFQLGKGSGKDFTSTIAVAYIVYLLLCLKDPAAYYGKPSGDNIDILNVAINAQQAQNVFFNGFKQRIERSPWFRKRYEAMKGQFKFDKNINVYSGHSERESWEGYNVIYVVLDEISGFAIDSTSGNEKAKTAEAIYDTCSNLVVSRFDEYGKTVLLSFPRYKDDFIQQRYNAVVLEKETILKTHTLKLDPDLPDGTEGNEFVIEWEHDVILSYAEPKVYALKRASWEVNPTKTPESYAAKFFANPVDTLSRYACMPPEAIDAFFKDKEKIESAFRATNGVDNETGRFEEWFKPDKKMRYFVHVDLAKKHDHCAVSLAHVEKWEQKQIGNGLTEPAPVIRVDAVRWWTPTPGNEVNFEDVRDYIVSLRARGFNVRLVTFDRWRSDDMIKFLNGVGMPAEVLSVDIKHYTDMMGVVQEGRLVAPNIPLLKKELLRLRIMPNGKIDHPRTGSKDLADATCGAIFNAIAHTPRSQFDAIEIVTSESLRQQRIEEMRRAEINLEPEDDGQFHGQIKPPGGPRQMPPELSDFLDALRVI
jgi:hypothetical protein